MIKLKNGLEIQVRKYQEDDFPSIHALNREDQWNNLVAKKEDTISAWNHSNIAYVAMLDDKIIGYIRGMTDQSITMYICELLIDQTYRSLGIGHNLLYYVHRLYPNTRVEMLASSTSHTYYETKGYRAFYGFRKNFTEYK